MWRTRADHGRAGAHQFTEALRHLRRHVHIVGRQNQRGVTRAAGQRDAAVFHRRAMQQHIGVNRVVVVAGGQRRLADARYHRRGLSVEIRGVHHRGSLLQQIFATRKVINPRLALFPPSHRALEVYPERAH